MSLADTLPPDWLDLCPGDAVVLRQALLKHFDLPELKFEEGQYCSSTKHLNHYTRCKKLLGYHNPSGFYHLTKFLEDKHKAPVIITNGAKQALSAVFYALTKSGIKDLGYRCPVWNLIPPLAKLHGLNCSPDRYEAFLAVMPNNPDGYTYPLERAKDMADGYKDMKAPFIHDAAYYTPVYLDDKYEYGPIGDVQIFSISKMLGLSSLRIGYAVFHDTTLYKSVQEYIEMTTVGVSAYSQAILLELFKAMQMDPDKERRFIIEARDALYRAKFIAKTIRKDIIDLPNELEHTIGMFAFGKLLKRDAFEKAKIRVSPGTDCAPSGRFNDYVRLNLAVDFKTLIEAIERLNKVGT